MSEILELRNRVQSYAWGSKTAIPELLGAAPSAEPQAELWMGAHPKAPSQVRLDGRWLPLDQVVRGDPERFLGPRCAARDDRLPFLFKVLAAEQALSIQVHPNRRQAIAGFEREEAAGVPRWADRRNYRDRNHKPEVIYALGPFWMLRGFRPVARIVELLAGLELAPFPGLAQLERAGEDGLRDFFAGLLRLDAERVRRLVDAAVANLARRRPADPAYGWVERLARQFPGDRGVFAPLLLNLVRLDAGRAMYTGAGILHAYLEGTGLELMASSDNVVRGALTAKHVDVDELLTIVRFETETSGPLEAVAPRPGVRRFVMPSGLALSELRVRPERPLDEGEGERGAEILLCVEGRGEVRTADGGPPLSFERGDSFLVPAAVSGYRLSGHARLFRAEDRPSDADADADADASEV